MRRFGPRGRLALPSEGASDLHGSRRWRWAPTRPRRAAQVNLGALNERWVKIEFLCDFYKGTDVPLLKFGEEDYEALENDQLTVQGMMASRYIAQFEKEVSMWSVALLNVSDSA